MTLEQQLYNGERAREVLDNPAFAQAFEAIKQELVEQWKQAPARDLTGKEHLWNLHKLTEKLELALRSMLDTGTLARVQLKHERSLIERAKQVAGMTY